MTIPEALVHYPATILSGQQTRRFTWIRRLLSLHPKPRIYLLLRASAVAPAPKKPSVLKEARVKIKKERSLKQVRKIIKGSRTQTTIDWSPSETEAVKAARRAFKS